MNRTKLLFRTLAGIALSVGSGHASIVAPYTVDSDTLHLWHFDKDATANPSNSQDSVPGGVAVSNQTGSTWGNPAFAGFGFSGNTSAASNSIIRSTATTLRPVPVGAGGAFTFEAMINTSTLSGGQHIFSMDQNGATANRPFFFRIINGDLAFQNIGNGNVDTRVTIPTTGDDAFVASEWFHVAVTYNGNDGVADNLKFYWTRVDESRTEANLIGSGTMGDLQGTAVYGIGNAYRTVGSGVTQNLEGSIDEVRISGIARGADEMLFAGPEPSTTFPLIITPSSSTPGNYDFEWQSQPGKLYDLVSSTDLTTAPATWSVWQGQSGIAATAPVNSLVGIVGGTDPTRFFAVTERDLLDADFEAGGGSFTTSPTAGTDWEWGTPDSNNSFGFAVTSGNDSSSGCWAVNLGDFTESNENGFYINPTTTYLRSSVIDLGGAGISQAALSFAQSLDVGAGDTAEVYVIDDTTDTLIDPAPIYTATDGSQVTADWSTANEDTPITLPAAAIGQSVRIEWRFRGTQDGYLGWYIDDVTVTAN